MASIQETEKIEKHSRRNVFLGTVLGYVAIGINILYGFFFTPWIISSLGDSSYGIYTLCASLISLFTIDFGLSATTNAYLSKYKAADNKEKIASFLGSLYKVYLLIDIILFAIFVVVYVFIDAIYVGLTPNETASLKTVFLISALYSVFAFPGTIFSGVLSAYEEFGVYKLVDICAKVLSAIFSVLVIVLNGGLMWFVLAQILSNIAALLSKYLFIRIKLKVKARFFQKDTSGEIKQIVSFSIWAAIASLSSRLVFNITPSILGITSDSTNISIFGVIAIIEGYIYSFGSVMGGFFLTKIQRIKALSNSKNQLLNLGIKIGRIQFFILALAVIGFYCCGEEFILIWMHGDATYLPVRNCVSLIVVYQLISVPEIVFHNAIYCERKYIMHYAFISIGKAVLNVALSFPLSYFYGVYGACFAIFVARGTEIVLVNFLYKKDLKIQLNVFFKSVFLRFLPACGAGLAVGLLLHFLLPFSYLVKFCIEVPSICLAYFLLAAPFLPKEWKSKLPFARSRRKGEK